MRRRQLGLGLEHLDGSDSAARFVTDDVESADAYVMALVASDDGAALEANILSFARRRRLGMSDISVASVSVETFSPTPAPTSLPVPPPVPAPTPAPTSPPVPAPTPDADVDAAPTSPPVSAPTPPSTPAPRRPPRTLPIPAPSLHRPPILPPTATPADDHTAKPTVGPIQLSPPVPTSSTPAPSPAEEMKQGDVPALGLIVGVVVLLLLGMCLRCDGYVAPRARKPRTSRTWSRCRSLDAQTRSAAASRGAPRGAPRRAAHGGFGFSGMARLLCARRGAPRTGARAPPRRGAALGHRLRLVAQVEPHLIDLRRAGGGRSARGCADAPAGAQSRRGRFLPHSSRARELARRSSCRARCALRSASLPCTSLKFAQRSALMLEVEERDVVPPLGEDAPQRERADGRHRRPRAAGIACVLPTRRACFVALSVVAALSAASACAGARINLHDALPACAPPPCAARRARARSRRVRRRGAPRAAEPPRASRAAAPPRAPRSSAASSAAARGLRVGRAPARRSRALCDPRPRRACGRLALRALLRSPPPSTAPTRAARSRQRALGASAARARRRVERRAARLVRRSSCRARSPVHDACAQLAAQDNTGEPRRDASAHARRVQRARRPLAPPSIRRRARGGRHVGRYSLRERHELLVDDMFTLAASNRRPRGRH